MPCLADDGCPDWSEPESIDIDTIKLEFTTNYFSYLALTKELVPFLRSHDGQTALVYISSGLALVPMPARSNYCATKAALHQWVLCLRASLQDTNINVVEVYPPAVQTELHDERHQPDIKNGRSMGMPLDEFTQAVSTMHVLGNHGILMLDRLGMDSARARRTYQLASLNTRIMHSRPNGAMGLGKCWRG